MKQSVLKANQVQICVPKRFSGSNEQQCLILVILLFINFYECIPSNQIIRSPIIYITNIYLVYPRHCYWKSYSDSKLTSLLHEKASLYFVSNPLTAVQSSCIGSQPMVLWASNILSQIICIYGPEPTTRSPLSSSGKTHYGHSLQGQCKLVESKNRWGIDGHGGWGAFGLPPDVAHALFILT